MTRLYLRYVPFQNSLEPLYEIYDHTGETYGEPRPYTVAKQDMKLRQASVDANALDDAAVIGMLGGFV
jgi:hypothetical protein